MSTPTAITLLLLFFVVGSYAAYQIVDINRPRKK